MTYIEVFFLLQLLDFLTTLVGLKLGGAELSPFIGWVMSLTDPLTGLTVAKGLVVALGAACVWFGRTRVFQTVNYIFAAVVVWNMVQILKVVAASV